MTKSFHTAAEDQNRLFHHHLPDSPFWASVENHGRQLAPMEENLAKNAAFVIPGTIMPETDITHLGFGTGL